MAGGIKGITVKIGGDTTELGKSLSSATKQSTALQRELKGVNTLLKFDPKNVTLLKQKADLLKQSITETKQKLHDLVEVQKKVDSGEIEMTEEEYRNLQREIASTQQALIRLTEEQRNFGSVGAQQIANVGKSLQDVGGKIEGVGEKMLPITGAIAGIGAVAVKTTADFDSSMSNVSAISGATGKDLEDLRNKAREMGSQTKFSASESADAMSYMAMAGWKTKDMIDGIEGVMDLASASGEELASTSDILTDGLTAFGLAAKDAGRMADVMAAASSNANTNVSLLGESYKYCASAAGAMGYSLEDITESLGLMANAGVKGSQAGTSLKTAMINLAKPTKAMSKAMDKYGISITNSDGSMKSWNEVVDNLRDSLGELTEAEETSAVATIFGKEATAGMLSVINAAPEDVEKLNKAINNSTGCAKKMSDTMNNNLSGQLTILKSQMEELSIAFGEMLMPIIRKVVSAVQKFVDKLNGMSEGQRKVILVILAVVAAIGPLLIVIGKLVASVGIIMTRVPKIASVFSTVGAGVGATLGPILAIVAVVGVLVGAFVTLWNTNKDFRENIISTWNSIKEKFVSFAQGITERVNALGFNFSSFGEMVKAAWGKLCEILAPIFEALFHQIGVILSSALDFLTGIFDIFIGIFTGDWSQAWEGVKEVFGSVWNLIKGTFKSWCMAFKGITSTILSWFGTSWSKVFTNVKKVVTKILTSIKNTISKIFNAIKSTISKVWNSIKNVTTKVWNGIKTTISNVLNKVKSTVSKVVNSIKSTISKVWNGIKSSTTKVWNGIKSAMIKPIESAKSKIKRIVDKIKGFFSNLKLKIPKPTLPKLPHFTLTTGTKTIMGKEIKYPTGFDVQWYAKGGILKAPTIFGALGGNLLGGGEAGPEAVAPIDVLQKYVREAVSDRNIELERKLDTVIGLMSNYYPEAIRAMDRPVVVGAKSIDTALADRNNKVVRGW